MEIKKIKASSMREALFQVKKELGVDAVIIKTRTNYEHGIFGFGNKAVIEVLACNDKRFIGNRNLADFHEESQMKLKQQYHHQQQHNIATFVAPLPKKTIENSVKTVLNKYETEDGLTKLKEDVSCIKKAIESITHHVKYNKTDLSDDLASVYSYLIEQEIAQELATELVHSIKDELTDEQKKNKQLVFEKLKHQIGARVKNCEPIKLVDGKTTRVALIGPTGVGKTTTVAKLAANFSLVQKKKVSVITIDTYRIAAVEQIKTYMEILGITLEVVTTPHEMRQAIKRQEKSDVVIIDTAGRSQKNSQQLEELKSFLEAANCDEIHLVLSSTTNYKNTMDIVNKFSIVPINKIIFTKLDEALNLGLIISVVAKMDKTLSYMTKGQSVPDDIELADSKKISSLVMEGCLNV